MNLLIRIIFIIALLAPLDFRSFAQEEPILLEGLDLKKPPKKQETEVKKSKQQKKTSTKIIDKKNPIMFVRAEITISVPPKPQIKQEVDPKLPVKPELEEPGRDPVKLAVELRYDDKIFHPGMIEQTIFGEKNGLLVILNQNDFLVVEFSNLHTMRDFVFIGSDNIINEIIPNKPANKAAETILSNYPVSSVLQLDGGMAKKYDIRVGDQVEVKKF